MTKDRILELSKALRHLREGQLIWIEAVIRQFKEPQKYMRNPRSNLISEALLNDFGDALKIHHCFSSEPFTKDKVEYALARLLTLNGTKASLASRGNPGHDLNINGISYSLKTQADSNINPERIHISKFMELGKGRWGSNPRDLDGLRQQFLKHMKSYQKVIVLRCLVREANRWHYELVEIPKSLLEESKAGKLEMRMNSSQNPKPGYCHVYGSKRDLKFQLYFDGGTERKLQIKNLRKDLCTVHADWEFSSSFLGI